MSVDLTNADGGGSTASTRILDWNSATVVALDQQLDAQLEARDLVRAAHRWVQENVRPVYGMNEHQPASVTARRGRGSCSQRLAIVEAIARGRGIATRVRGLVVEGAFWKPRFPRVGMFIPEEILLAWPEFLLDDDWVSASHVFAARIEDVDGKPFTNSGAETLFDALARGAADWAPARQCLCADASLRRFVLADLGLFPSRDELFQHHRQNPPRAVRVALDPFLSRWSPA